MAKVVPHGHIRSQFKQGTVEHNSNPSIPQLPAGRTALQTDPQLPDEFKARLGLKANNKTRITTLYP